MKVNIFMNTYIYICTYGPLHVCIEMKMNDDFFPRTTLRSKCVSSNVFTERKPYHIYIYIIHKKAFADNEPDGSFRQHDASVSEGAWVTPLVVVVAVEVVAVVLMLVP